MIGRSLVWLALSACGFQSKTDVIDASNGAEPGITIDAPAIDAVTIDAPTGPWLAGFMYRKPITITRSGTMTLANFPVAMVIASDAQLAAHARLDGADLVITAADGLTRLDSQLVAYNAGSAELWTRVPSLPVGTTTLYLYYGAGTQTTDPQGVWTSTFKGVWHLSDPPGSNAAIDSTTAAHHLGQAIPTQVPGNAAAPGRTGRVFDGIDDFFEIADPADGSLDVGAQSFSFSLWVFGTGTIGAFDTPFFKGGTSTGNPGYCLLLGTGQWAAKLHDGTDFVDVEFSPTPLSNQWVHLVTVVDRTPTPDTVSAYVNGVRTSNFNLTLGSFDTSRELRVGAGSAGTRFQGVADEARVYGVALTGDWIATEHANLATPGFVTVGNEQMQ